MTLFGHGLETVGGIRSFCLHDQPPAEAQQMGAMARRLRCVRQQAGYSRRELARRLGVGVDVVVAIENGFGSLAVAQPLVERAAQLAAQVK